MVSQIQPYVNDTSVSDVQESSLTSFTVVHAANGRPDVNLRLHGQDRACVVHLPADLAQLGQALDLREGQHAATKGVIAKFREQNGRLVFVDMRIERTPPKVRLPGEERVGKLIAIMPGDWCGKPILSLKVAGETRKAEAAGKAELEQIRELGIAVDGKRWVWTDAPAGFVVRYIVPTSGPKLDFIALEREAAPVAPSTPTDDKQGAVALLPAWSRAVSERLIFWHEMTLPTTLPSDAPIPLPAALKPVDPVVLAALNGEEVAIEITAPRQPKDRRYPRRQPVQQVGGNTFKFTSELLERLPSDQRQETVRMVQRLLAHDLLPYLHSKENVGTLREGLRRFEEQSMDIKGKVSHVRKAAALAANPDTSHAALAIRHDPTPYEKQAADAYLERMELLKTTVKDWLGLDVTPEGGEASLEESGAKVRFAISGYSSAPSLQISLSSPLLDEPIRKSVFMHERAEEVYAAMWKTFDEVVEEQLNRTLARSRQKERRLPLFPLRPQYMQQ